MKAPSFTRRRSAVDLQLTPMIDCVFLLMVYFIWSSSFQITEQTVPGPISAASGGGSRQTNEPPPPEADFDNVVVRVLWQNQKPAWLVNSTPMNSLRQLRTELSRIARIKRDVPVILHPDRPVPLGDVLDAYDTARLVGFSKIQFAASDSP